MELFNFHPKVKNALDNDKPVVALESTVITHGLPKPTNFETAAAMEDEVRKAGATPATICLLRGKIHIGIDESQLRALADSENCIKVSRKDLAFASARGLDGGTTVSGTMITAHAAGIEVFATGGIGGVHRGNPQDVSADLPTLAQVPMVIVCAGAKSILDIPATKETLETFGVPVLGYQTDELPAFFSVHSGVKADHRVNSPEEVAATAISQWELGLKTAILVAVPLPLELEIPAEKVNLAIDQALMDAETSGITGPKITPFLLQRVKEITKGESMDANIELLKNNARIASEIAVALKTLSGNS